MATYVLVHGAWHGGWCWKKVTPLLRARGHEVFTPTLIGLGERSHLATRSSVWSPTSNRFAPVARITPVTKVMPATTCRIASGMDSTLCKVTRDHAGVPSASSTSRRRVRRVWQPVSKIGEIHGAGC